MSLEVYGYLKNNSFLEKQELVSQIEQTTSLGFVPMPKEWLHNFPNDFLPINEKDIICFLIGDRPGKRNATYLIDFQDYDPIANIGLPTQCRERIKILVSAINFIIEISKTTIFLIAVTDSSQIEKFKRVKLSELLNTILKDFEEDETPPDCLYEIIID